MDWKNLFLSANGRIGQKDFWIGILILIVAGVVLGMIPMLGQIVAIALIYPTVCVYAKRLHDFGKSGWLVVVPYAVCFIAAVLGFLLGGAAILAGAAGGAAGNGAVAASALGGLGLFLLLLLLALVFAIGFLLWVGLSKGDPGPNQYGPAPTGGLVTAV